MRCLLFLLVFLFSTFNYALSLKPNSPEHYVVKSGDSLWSISCQYLNNPWEWKALWHANPKIKNPKRLYPGDELILAYMHNKPYIKVLANDVVKMSPNMRPKPIAEAIPAIPLGDIKPFLNESLVLDENLLGRAPYVVAYIGEHMMGGQGDEVYVKGLHPSPQLPEEGSIAYSIFRQGRSYLDPVTKEVLGFAAALVGYARLVTGGDPATILLTNINEGIKIQDRVLINDSPEFDLFFEPKTPMFPVAGLIIDMPDGMPSSNTQTAVGSVVLINRGERNGLEAGDVLGIYRKARVVPDPQNSLVPIKLPPERTGEVMVFRVFSKTSFALIVRSTRPVYLLNAVANP